MAGEDASGTGRDQNRRRGGGRDAAAGHGGWTDVQLSLATHRRRGETSAFAARLLPAGVKKEAGDGSPSKVERSMQDASTAAFHHPSIRTSNPSFSPSEIRRQSVLCDGETQGGRQRQRAQSSGLFVLHLIRD